MSLILCPRCAALMAANVRSCPNRNCQARPFPRGWWGLAALAYFGLVLAWGALSCLFG
jgi:hypothetical protein